MIFFIILLGLAIGSFLNVCIYRLPQTKSIAYPPSHCPSCGNRIKPWDLIPVISYLFLRGKCRYCSTPISVRYVIIEILTAILFLWCFKIFGMSFALIKAMIFTSFLTVIFFIDYDHQLIFDRVLVWFAGTGVIINMVLRTYGFFDILYGTLLGGGLLLVIAILSRGGMGGGDIKFTAALGIWLGWKLTLLTIFLSFILGGAVGLLLLVFKVKKRKDMMPFGPFIAIGAYVSLLYGMQFINWYFKQFI